MIKLHCRDCVRVAVACFGLVACTSTEATPGSSTVSRSTTWRLAGGGAESERPRAGLSDAAEAEHAVVSPRPIFADAESVGCEDWSRYRDDPAQRVRAYLQFDVSASAPVPIVLVLDAQGLRCWTTVGRCTSGSIDDSGMSSDCGGHRLRLVGDAHRLQLFRDGVLLVEHDWRALLTVGYADTIDRSTRGSLNRSDNRPAAR